MAVIPFNNWQRLRQSLADYLAIKDPVLEKIEVRIRFPAGSEETVSTVLLPGQNFTVDSLLARIVMDVEHHTACFEPIARLVVRVFPCGRQNARIASAGSDQCSINTDGNGPSVGGTLPDLLAPTGIPAPDILGAKMHAGQVSTQEGPTVAWLLYTSHLQNMQLTRDMLNVFSADRADMQGTIRELGRNLNESNVKALDAVLAQRQAQQDADRAKGEKALADADRTLKHELMKQFGGNFNSLMSLLMTKAMGLPPNDPVLLKSYIAGMSRQSPEMAKELASMAFASGAFSLDAIKPQLVEWAKANPQEALDFGAEMVVQIERVQAEQAAKPPAAQKA